MFDIDDWDTRFLPVLLEFYQIVVYLFASFKMIPQFVPLVDCKEI